MVTRLGLSDRIIAQVALLELKVQGHGVRLLQEVGGVGEHRVILHEDKVALPQWGRAPLFRLLNLEVLAAAHRKEEGQHHELGEDVHWGVSVSTRPGAHFLDQWPRDRFLLGGSWVVVLVSSEQSL